MSTGTTLSPDGSRIGRFANRHRLAIIFVTLALCVGGIYGSLRTPSSVFPETDFPRCVVLIDNGAMPADEMMATITRPVEEAMKDIPGVTQVRSATGRGSAEVNVFFNWRADMPRSELYVLNRVAQLKNELPATAKATVWRLTFNAFPIIGISVTSPGRDIMELWELARYELKPRFMRLEGVARVDLVGGRMPEYHVVVDPLRLAALGLGMHDVVEGLRANNRIEPAGFHSENYTIYLAMTEGRARSAEELAALPLAVRDGSPVRIGDVARVERGPEPVFNFVNAQGRPAVLMNIRAQPRGSSILAIARNLQRELRELRHVLPPDVELSFYYDQSLFVRESVRSVWESIGVGLIFAVLILYGFLNSWGSVLTAVVVIPVSVFATVVAILAAGMTFNLMTLGGIAAAIGVIIDDAIVVVESIVRETAGGGSPEDAIGRALGAILRPLIGSTLMPVVVFAPLAFLDGLPGVFFRALAVTMVVALLASLVLAVTLTPALASWCLRPAKHGRTGPAQEGPWMQLLLAGFGAALRGTLRWRWALLLVVLAVATAGAALYRRLETAFLPAMDEGGFVIDYLTPWGTSLEETDRMLQQAETILRETPELEGYSRRTGARLALAIAEPNKGDILVKLRPDRRRTTEEIKSELRQKLNRALPGIEWEFPGILADLVGDLTWAPDPIEVKLFSTDTAWLMRTAPKVRRLIEEVPGVVDTSDGLRMTGPTLALRVRHDEVARHGLTVEAVAEAMNIAVLGQVASTVSEADRVVPIRVVGDPACSATAESLRDLPIRARSGRLVTLGQIADVAETPGQLELRRENLRQMVAVTASLEGRGLGAAIADIRARLARQPDIPPGVVEYGGLYEQQVESFRNLAIVLALAIVLVFTLLLIEFRSFREPAAIVAGSVLALVGSVGGVWITGTSLNIVSFLGAIIGVGIVAKNGILMLDCVGQFRAAGHSLDESLVLAGRRRLRPILMTSLSTMLAMLPLAWGIGHGADMLRPLAIGVIGALTVSLLLSLFATPALYRLIAPPRDSSASIS
ncbi:MAG: efflux RND transporter permease subunit [Kiritimatiellae bacterium]|nr:efflux RND transporter permease subunit [Kiritimatiellia bacterium]